MYYVSSSSPFYVWAKEFFLKPIQLLFTYVNMIIVEEVNCFACASKGGNNRGLSWVIIKPFGRSLFSSDVIYENYNVLNTYQLPAAFLVSWNCDIHEWEYKFSHINKRFWWYLHRSKNGLCIRIFNHEWSSSHLESIKSLGSKKTSFQSKFFWKNQQRKSIHSKVDGKLV